MIPVTPAILRTYISAARRSKSHSMVPLNLTMPLVTTILILSSGTAACIFME